MQMVLPMAPRVFEFACQEHFPPQVQLVLIAQQARERIPLPRLKELWALNVATASPASTLRLAQTMDALIAQQDGGRKPLRLLILLSLVANVVLGNTRLILLLLAMDALIAQPERHLL